MTFTNSYYINILQGTGITVLKAAEACGKLTSSAYRLLNYFNDSNGTILLVGIFTQKGKAKPKQLFPVHTEKVLHQKKKSKHLER